MSRPGMIELELPVAVSENQYRRFVPGAKFPIISREGRKYQETVKLEFRQRGQSQIPGPVKVHIEFYPPDRRKRDLDNQFKCLLDSLVYAGAIEDDSNIMEIHAYKREPMSPSGLLYVKIEPI